MLTKTYDIRFPDHSLDWLCLDWLDSWNVSQHLQISWTILNLWNRDHWNLMGNWKHVFALRTCIEILNFHCRRKAHQRCRSTRFLWTQKVYLNRNMGEFSNNTKKVSKNQFIWLNCNEQPRRWSRDKKSQAWSSGWITWPLFKYLLARNQLLTCHIKCEKRICQHSVTPGKRLTDSRDLVTSRGRTEFTLLD